MVDLFLSIQSTSLSVIRYYQQIHERNNRTFAIEELLIFDQDEEKSSRLKLNKIQANRAIKEVVRSPTCYIRRLIQHK